MSDEAAPAPPERREPREWAKRALLVVGFLGLLIVLGFLGAAFLPRWWSHRIGSQVSGGFATGIVVGLFYGFIFTLLPFAILWQTFRKRRRLKVWSIGFVIAVVAASPNLLTLGIVLGAGSGAHAGERTLDVQAPGFRGSTLAGAIVALLVFGLLVYVLVSGKRVRLHVRRLKRKLSEQEQHHRETLAAGHDAGAAPSNEQAGEHAPEKQADPHD